MTDDFVKEFLAEDQGFPGFTAEQWRAIDKGLKPYLKPDTDWNIEKFLTFSADEEELRKTPPHTPADIKELRKCLRIPTEIESCLYDLTDGSVPPGTVLYEGTTQRNLKSMENALKEAAAIYDSSDEPLQMHLDDQMPESGEKTTAYESQPGEEWAELRHERTATKRRNSEVTSRTGLV